MVQIVCVSPHKTLAGKFSRLAGKSFAGPGKVSNDLKIVVMMCLVFFLCVASGHNHKGVTWMPAMEDSVPVGVQ